MKAIVPTIVAMQQYLNQNASVPVATIFTPPVTGLYRFSAYMDLLSGENNTVQWNLSSSDDLYSYTTSASQEVGQFPPQPVSTFPNAFAQSDSVILVLKAGQPVQFRIDVVNPSPTTNYNVRWILEDLNG